jgi:hypothetical protein
MAGSKLDEGVILTDGTLASATKTLLGEPLSSF